MNKNEVHDKLTCNVINDFDLLCEKGTVGFYNRCEVIEIFGLKDKKVFNIFTLVVFEKSGILHEQEKYLTNGLMKINGYKDIKWGISRRIISIDDCKSYFYNLINNNIHQLGDEPSNIGKILFTQKKYIAPQDYMEHSQINNVLKNNFENGSYIIEAFDIDKENIKFLIEEPVALNSFSEAVSKILPIQIGSLSDRLGNVVFQFPIKLFKMDTSIIKPKESFKVRLTYDELVSQIPKVKLLAYTKHDNCITSLKMYDIQEEIKVNMLTSDSIIVNILDETNDLILSSNVFSILENMNFNLLLNSNQDRVFKIKNQLINVGISSQENFWAHNDENDEAKMENWINSRKYENELNSLESKKSFIQYYEKQHEKALNDIRELIKKYGHKGVYLWDPYLNAIDIKNTLYYTPYSDVPLRAITNLKDTEKSNKLEIIKKLIEEFESDNKKYLFMNLEVRSKIGNCGWNFHDRFLIFPLDKPRVWSLGISINEIGQSHHIVQEIKNAQHILNAFNKLWDELEDKECLIWKSI